MYVLSFLQAPWGDNLLIVSASADRRPVDPPPVVELKVLEGDAKTDITFAHNANFFLYTTLESARPIAQGRGSTIPPPYPVLTGMPVAGMAYLDRPSPAGYFIFPDLSVRHEGKYRLSFNLYEELKEDKDADADPTFSSPTHPNNEVLRSSPVAPQGYAHFRLEVKSEPFIVYSAKKFPGLAESTALSRVVAEQGCRVRIRRDVRMRRRDNKSSKDYDEYEEDGVGYVRPERYATPDVYAQQPAVDRARSVSNVSVESHTSYAAIERRPSSQVGYYNQPTYPQPQSVPQPASNGYSSHLTFGGSSANQYHAPALPGSGSAMSQPTSSYSTNYPYQPHPQGRQMTGPPGYGYHNSQPYSYPPSQPYGESADYRRTSLPSSATGYPSQSQTAAYAPNEVHTPSQHQSYYPQTATTVVPRAATPSNVQQLPPLKTLQPPPERKYDQPPSAGGMSGAISAPPPQTWDQTQSPYAYSANTQAPVDNTARPAKRSFASVFDTSHINEPIHGGMRPSTATHGQGVAQIELDDGTVEDEEEFPNMKLLSYRRADGSRKHKKCPSPIAG